MKKLFLLSLAGLFAVSAFSQTPVVNVKKVDNGSLTIDGAREAAWNDLSGDSIKKVFQGETITDNADLSGDFKIAYDDDAVYLSVVAKDDSIYYEGAGADWQKDLIEVYFNNAADLYLTTQGASSGISEGDHDKNNGIVQLVIHTNPIEGTIDDISWATGVEIAQNIDVVPATNVYQYEFKVPFTFLVDADGAAYDPAAGDTLGFDVYLCDNDAEAGGTSRNRKVWSNAGPSENWGNAKDAGGLLFKSVAIKHITKNAASASIVNNMLVLKNTKTVELYSITGQLVLKKSNVSSVNVSNLASGVYVAKLNGTTTTKLIKR